jgi:hypothetical protein
MATKISDYHINLNHFYLSLILCPIEITLEFEIARVSDFWH